MSQAAALVPVPLHSSAGSNGAWVVPTAPHAARTLPYLGLGSVLGVTQPLGL